MSVDSFVAWSECVATRLSVRIQYTTSAGFSFKVVSVRLQASLKKHQPRG